MPGGITQLINRGVEDRKLTFRPKITFFQALYEPYVQFAINAVENQFGSTPDFNRTCHCKINRTADLVNNMIMELTLSSLTVTPTTQDVIVTVTSKSLTALSVFTTSTMTIRVLYKDTSGIVHVGLGDVNFASVPGATEWNAAKALGVDVAPPATTGVDAVGAAIHVAWIAATGGSFPYGVAQSSNVPAGGNNVFLYNYTLGALANTLISFEIISASLVTASDRLTTTDFTISVTQQANSIAWVDDIGHAVIDWISIEIGGQEVDRQYGLWYDVWSQLTLDASRYTGYLDMIGQQYVKTQEYTNATLAATTPATEGVAAYVDGLQTFAVSHPQTKLYIPIKFWFNDHPGLALPMLALNQQQIIIKVKFADTSARPLYRVLGSGSTAATAPSIVSATIWADYILLDPRERSWYTRNSLEYLFTQLQYNDGDGVASNAKKFKITFNNPVKELIWAVIEDAAVSAGYWNRYATYNGVTAVNGYLPAGAQSISTASIYVGGNKITDTRDASYYSRQQPYFYHTRIPETFGLYVHSFSLDPEDFQPSGTLNMSRTDTVELELALTNTSSTVTGKCHIFGVSLNFLEIDRGLGGAAFQM